MKLLLCDVDGTLVCPGNPVHISAFDHALQTLLGDPDLTVSIMRLDGMIDREILLTVLRQVHTEANARSLLPQAVQMMGDFYAVHQHEFPCRSVAGIENALQQLQQHGFGLGLLTGNIERIAWCKVDQVSLGRLFPFGVFGDQADSRDELVEHALTKGSALYGPLSRSDLVLIGDTPRDLACAQRTGVACIAVASGRFSVEELQEAIPKSKQTSFRSLVVQSLFHNRDRVEAFLREA